MTDETPVDYVVAALAYIIIDDGENIDGATIEEIHASIEKQYKVNIPYEATTAALTVLDHLDVLTLPVNKYGPGIVNLNRFSSERIVELRFSNETHAGVVLNAFMSGPPDWMERALNSERLQRDLQEQLQAGEDTPSQMPSDRQMRLIEGVTISRMQMELTKAVRDLDDLRIGNSDKAQVHALLAAAVALSEAPDPPVSLIWELLQRANSIAGIASLLVTIIAFFVSH